jgi:hypothetical protein
MKCVSTNRLASRLVVSLLVKFEWAAPCEIPGVSRRSTTCVIMAQPRNQNINLTLNLNMSRLSKLFCSTVRRLWQNNLQMEQWRQQN